MNKKQETYQQMEQNLQKVLQRIEDNSYEKLDDLLKDYDTGVELIGKLQKHLDTALNKIKVVKK